MPFHRIDAPDLSAKAKAPIKAVIKLKDGKPLLWISLSAAAQEDAFARALKGANLDIKVGDGRESGQLMITLAAGGKHHAIGTAFKACRIPVGRFEGLPAITTKPRPCTVVRSVPDSGLLIIRLPDWS